MNGQQNADELPRRQFVAFSGAMGAAVLLTGAGSMGSTAAAAGGPAPGGTPPESCPTPPPGSGQSPCPPAQLQSVCGRPTDNDPLWRDVRYCTQGTPPPPPQPKPECLKVTPNYVVLHGKPENQHNYLMVPSCRITGIECPFLLSSGVENYWNDAWQNARSGGSVPVRYADIGLGINSQSARRLNQLHIHMAGIRSRTQRRLQELETMGRVTANPAQWGSSAFQVSIEGAPGSGDRTYRALRLPNLDQNLFALVNRYVVMPAGLDMADQTLIVVPKMTSAGFAGTFYVLSSDNSLHDGTSTCDHLLVYS
ncbi:CDP-diacylglycerol pyrophosphatase [Streptomyces sp. ADI96-02]|uniref:CDP-diacylglycerol diphosphatase n=1 Tax=Streptomyces sp. ADI96-02 TaxID=1522760 RepID=UPI000FB1710C|nr:CDP-diacylglycerol diphosphatase [Streptomyces sp. ADI96-02]RPK66448.1 CDP-diacylglycerol pyrophosphatase [Streptomyces sp. ADI96-02]